MLDDLLGKTALKERIEELEDEVESLEKRLSAEERRRKDAVTEKQESDRRVNELEDKIEELRDRLERAGGDDDGRSFRVARAVRGDELDDALELFSSTRSGGEALTTVTVAPDDRVPDEFDTETTALLRRIESPTGFVAFGDDTGVVRAALSPPLDVKETRVEYADSFVFDRSAFELPSPYAVAVVRSDEYAGGVYDDGRVEFSSLSSDIISKHSKGGFSQSRFERGRDEEVKEHVRDSVERFDGMVDGYDVRHVFVAGESRVVRRFSDEVGVDVPVSERTADATDSGEDLLRRGHDSVRSARLYVV
ncbi:MAG: Vms1/Ankzf1 family peptidyl-tRNA hydrolase [Halobacteriales archaeon]